MKYFELFELVDRHTFETMGEKAWSLFVPEALIALDDFREYWARPVTINTWHSFPEVPMEEWESKHIFQWRGWRTPEQCIKEGSPHSRHGKGDAWDCDIEGVPAAGARAQIIAHENDPLLCKITRLEASVSWVHFDLAPVEHRIHIFSKG